jgi:adenylate kinase
MRIVLLGAPGSGKGTQCKRIVDQYGLAHLSSGDILRKERTEGSDLGQKAQGYMDSGALVPDELIIEMMVKAVNGAPEAGFVLDGFPRTVNQAAALDQALAEVGKSLDLAVNLIVDDEIIYDRMSGRRSCPVCGAVYHVTNLKPKVEGQCDSGCGALVQRPDDNREVVKKRLETYHQQTEPVVGYYKENGEVKDIDANKGADVVDVVIREMLDGLK